MENGYQSTDHGEILQKVWQATYIQGIAEARVRPCMWR